MSTGTKRLAILGLLALVALFLAGIITGAIGAAFTQSSEDKAAGKTAEGIIPEPSIHLPAQTVFPFSERQRYLDFLDAEHEEKLHPDDLHDFHGERTDQDGETLVDDGPFPGGFVISNTILSAWVVSALLLIVFVIGTRRMKLVPGRFQNVLESIIEGLLNFVESVVGRDKGRLVFPVIATIFLFVMFNAWIGLIPLYQALGYGEGGFWKFGDETITIHLLRPAGTDLNMPLALALVSFVFVEFLGLWLIKFPYFGKFIRLGSLKRGFSGLFRLKPLEAFQGFLDFAFIGPLEAFSEFVRVISFTFRLFGNMTAGEILVLISAFLVPFAATLFVYGLELLVGFIQALIFAGLTLVFAAVAMTPHHEEEGH